MRNLDHVFSVPRKEEIFFYYSKYPTALIVFSVIMEQLENNSV